MSDEPKLRELRAKIDALDEKLQDLINRRARMALDIAKVKQGSGHDNFYRPEREAEVLNKVLARNVGPLSNESIARLFREIMSACLALESRLKVAFLGPEGTFTQRRRSSTSAISSIPRRSAPSTRYSARSSPATCASAWCRSRTRPRA